MRRTYHFFVRNFSLLFRLRRQINHFEANKTLVTLILHPHLHVVAAANSVRQRVEKILAIRYQPNILIL